MDLSQLTTDELRTLLTRVSKEIEQRREEEKSRLLNRALKNPAENMHMV